MIVGVIGSGSIGPDLAYGFLSALAQTKGAKVYLVDIRQEALDSGVERILGYVKKGVSRGKLSAKAAKAIEEALTPTLNIDDLADCEYVLEAASEDLGVKRKILKVLESNVSEECLIGFATSGLPRAQIASEAKHPERCFVNHPFFPAWRSLPVEVVSSGDVALEARMMKTLKRLGKVPLLTADVPCFAADDIFCNYVSEAARIVEEGIASPAQVDRIVDSAIGGGGPFNVMDATRGNLLTVHCQELMRDAPTGSAWFEAPKILTEQGNDPWHDRKNPGDPSHDDALAETVLNRILAVLFSRTYFVVDRDICDPTDLNWMTRMALGFRKGLLELAEEYGATQVQAICEQYAEGRDGFDVPATIAAGKLCRFRATVKVEHRGDIGVISVFRPEVKNALSAQTIGEIDAAFTEMANDKSVKGVIFTSEDGSLAGADIMELAALETPDDCRDICLNTHPVLKRISEFEKPVVAALNGPVLGGGAEFSMACHARVIGPKLLIGQPEVNLGIIPGYGGTQRLPRLIGVSRAMELLRTGAPIGAAQACEWGWAVGEPEEDVMAAAERVLRAHQSGEQKLSRLDPGPLSVPAEIAPLDIGHRSLAIDAILVDVIRRGLSEHLDRGLEIEADGFGRCKATVDMDIGMKNFMQNGPRVPALFLHE